MMADKPILFSGEMVRAILDGRKTQTRRVIKFPLHRTWDTQIDIHQEVASVNRDGGGNWIAWSPTPMTDEQTARLYPNADGFQCPYGRPGDLLWVRETFAESAGDIIYRADAVYEQPGDCAAFDETDKWKPSIFMPRWASRITLEVTAVRIERLQDITQKDAKAEGAQFWFKGEDGRKDFPDGHTEFAGEHVAEENRNYVMGFHSLWDSINAKRGFGWDVNPFVWAVEFKKVQP